MADISDGRLRCDNCQNVLAGQPVAVRDQNHFCSAYCADRFQRRRVLTIGEGCSILGNTTKFSSNQTVSSPLDVPQISVLSAADREIIDEARRWFRRILLAMQSDKLPGLGDPRDYSSVVLDGLEREGIYDTLEKLNALAARHVGEPQLAEEKR